MSCWNQNNHLWCIKREKIGNWKWIVVYYNRESEVLYILTFESWQRLDVEYFKEKSMLGKRKLSYLHYECENEALKTLETYMQPWENWRPRQLISKWWFNEVATGFHTSPQYATTMCLQPNQVKIYTAICKSLLKSMKNKVNSRIIILSKWWKKNYKFNILKF